MSFVHCHECDRGGLGRHVDEFQYLNPMPDSRTVTELRPSPPPNLWLIKKLRAQADALPDPRSDLAELLNNAALAIERQGEAYQRLLTSWAKHRSGLLQIAYPDLFIPSGFDPAQIAREALRMGG